MLRWPLRITFALFQVLQLRGVVSRESPDKYFIIGRSFWDLFGSAHTSAVWYSAADSHVKLLDGVVRNAGVLAGGVLECNLALHRRSVAVLFMLFKIGRNPMHPLGGAWVTKAFVVLWLLISTRLRLLAVKLLSNVEPLCPFQCLSETILVTLYLMLWDWGVLRAEPMLSCWPNLLFLFVFYYFIFFFLPWVSCVGLGSSDW